MGVYDPNHIDTLFVGNEKLLLFRNIICSLSKPGFGPVGIFSQSGAIASAILNELAGRNNDGWISKFISFGNACDVNEIDILKYFSEEPSVKQAWAYLEGFRDGPAFMKIAKDLSRKKPMLVLKSNRSASGAKASASHSASLAANDAVCDQLLKNVGFCGMFLS